MIQSENIQRCLPYFFTSNSVVNVFCFQWSNFATTVHIPSLSNKQSYQNLIIKCQCQKS